MDSIEIEVKERVDVEVEDKREVVIKEVVKPPKLQEKSHTPTTQGAILEADEEFDGLSKVTVEPLETEELTLTPSAEEQNHEGLFDKVIVAGDVNLKPENISEGVNIFGVNGTANTTNVKITDAGYLFNNRARLGQLNELLKLCENVTSMSSMFYYCDSLTELDLSDFNTSNVSGSNMNSIFFGCSKLKYLNIKNFDTSKITEMRTLFSGCTSLESLDVGSFDTSKVTIFYEVFRRCEALKSLDVSNFNTSNATSFIGMFESCKSLVELDLSNFDMSKAVYVSNIFKGMTALEKLKSFKNLGKSYDGVKSANNSSLKLDLSTSPNLTHDSLVDLINNLYDLNLTYKVASGGKLYRQSLTLGSTNLAKLTEEEIAIATDKGWDVT